MGFMWRNVVIMGLSALGLALASDGLAAEQGRETVADSPQRPRVGTITLVGHDFIQVKIQSGETVKCLITARTQIGMPEKPVSFHSFKVGNLVTITAEETDGGLEAVEVFAGDQLLYFLNPKRPRRAVGDAPVRAGSILIVTTDQLVLRTAGGKDYKYSVTARTQFGDKGSPMKTSQLVPGNMVKVIGVAGGDDSVVAAQVLPFIQDVGNRHQAKPRQEIPEKMSPTPECGGWIVVVTAGYVEIRTKSGQSFRYSVTAGTQFGTKEKPSSLEQLKPGNYVKISAVAGADGLIEARQVASADYRK